MEELKEKWEDLVYWFKSKFSKGKEGGWASLKNLKNMSMDEINDFMENNESKFFIFLFLLVLWFLWLMWYFYIPLKTSLLNTEIQKENIKVLEMTKAEKEKNKTKYEEISDEVIVPKQFNISDLACFFMKFDKELIPYVNPEYKIATLQLDENEQSFTVNLNWIKYYKSLTDILVLLKQYKSLINVNSYSVNLMSEDSWGTDAEYYNIAIEGKFVGNELPKVDWDINDSKEETSK